MDKEILKKEHIIRDLIRSETECYVDFEYTVGNNVKIFTIDEKNDSKFLAEEFVGNPKAVTPESALDKAIEYFKEQRKTIPSWEFQWQWPGSPVKVSWFSGKTFKNAVDKFYSSPVMENAIVIKTEIKPMS